MKALLLAMLASCAYDTRFSDCAVRCAPGMECPDGFQCRAEGFCRLPDAEATCATVLGTFPSCVQLAATCGPDGGDDCCSTAEPIPGGTFYRSYDVAADGMYPSMSYPATVSAFRLDKYEVTVGRFRAFIEAGMGTQANPPPAGAGAHVKIADSGWDSNWDTNLAADTNTLVSVLKCNPSQSWTDAAGANEALPINCVSWYEAVAFCAWDDGFLPTEAEWNFAATGGDEQRVYPWSNPPSEMLADCSYANYKNDPVFCVSPPTGAVTRVGQQSPKGDGKWNQADLAGNVWEWTLDWYQGVYVNPCNDCAELTETEYRIVRGGGFYTADLRTAMRNYHNTPRVRVGDVGLRCARPPST